MKTHLSIINRQSPLNFRGVALNEGQKVKDAFKLLLKYFSEIPEIGKFKPVKVNIDNFSNLSKIKKATIKIEPSIKKDDFRTRVLTFSVKSPFDESIVHEVSPASGNKFSIESTLKNPKLVKMFQDFVNSIE